MRELGLRDGQMAERLGIPRTSFNAIKTRRYRISLHMARRVIAAFPDLAPYALVPENHERGHVAVEGQDQWTRS